MATEVVEQAIGIAMEAVQEDEVGNYAQAIQLYSKSIDCIKRGLQVQSADEALDNSVLHRYAKMYHDRIMVLRQHSSAIQSAAAASSSSSVSVKADSPKLEEEHEFASFSFIDADIAQAKPPGPPPVEPWRRVFWLMRVLCISMKQGGFISHTGAIFVPRRVWIQKGAKYPALVAKAECVETSLAAMQELCKVDIQNTVQLDRKLEQILERLDAQQNALARLLTCVVDVNESVRTGSSASAVSKLTHGFKGLAKALDKTAARLGAMQTRCTHPHEFVGALVELFEASCFLESMIDHFSANALAHASIYTKLHRLVSFFSEVVCAFVMHDLSGLIARHLRKATASFIQGGD